MAISPAESSRRYREKHKEKVAAAKKAYREANPDKVAKWRKTFNEKHPTKGSEYSKKSYAKRRALNPEKVKETWQKYYNKDNAVAAAKRWKSRNPHKVAASTVRRNAQKLNATPKWANQFIIDEVYHLAKLRTKHTGIKWEVDHIVPLRSKVVCGLHAEANLRVIPAIENNKKGNSLMEELL